MLPCRPSGGVNLFKMSFPTSAFRLQGENIVPQNLKLVILSQILHTSPIGFQHILWRFNFEVVIADKSQHVRIVVEHRVEDNEVLGAIFLLLKTYYSYGMT